MSRESHSFSVEYAELYGVECAILINHFIFWIKQNKAMGRNFYDGRTWMYQTQKEIAAIYPYWSEDVVCKIIKKLIDLNVLVRGNYNKTPFDKTSWYAFESEKNFTIPSNDGIDTVGPRIQNPSNDGIRIRQTTECIGTDTKTDAKQIQQHGVDVFSEKSQEKQQQRKTQPAKIAEPVDAQPKIYPCLINIDVLPTLKTYLTSNFAEQIVIDAVAWVTHPMTKITTTIAQALTWGCKNNAKPPIMPQDLEEQNKALALKYDKTRARNCIVDVCHAQVEFVWVGGQKQPDCLRYDAKGFREQFESLLRKAEIKIIQ